MTLRNVVVRFDPCARAGVGGQARGWRFFPVLSCALALAPVLVHAAPTASIVANRTNGFAPLAVRFDATGSDCDGNGAVGQWNQDLEQCHYSWDFGDINAPPYEYGAAARAGQAPSANKAQGFVAGHVFENPGIYTVELMIRNPNGQEARSTLAITVNAFSGATYCFRSSTSGSFAGCPSGAVQVTTSNFNTALGPSHCNIGSGTKRCLFRRGDTFSASGQTNASGSGTIIGAFGSGDRPIITGSDFTGIGSGSNVVVMDLDFNGAANTGGTHRLFYRTRHRNVNLPGGAAIMWYGSNLTSLYVVRTEISGSSRSVYAMATDSLYLGNKWSNAGGYSHNSRIGRLNKTVIASNELGPSGDGHVLKLVGEGLSCATSRYAVIRDNVFYKTSEGFNWVVSLRPQGAGDDFAHPIENVLVESNFWTGSGIGASGDRVALHVSQTPNLTIRNNIVDLTAAYASAVRLDSGSATISGCNPAQSSNVTLMNNSAVWGSSSPPSGPESIFNAASGVSGVRMVNNLFYRAANWSPVAFGCGGSSCSVSSNNLVVTTNPFVSSSFPHPWQFRLKDGSGAIGAGSIRPEVISDFRGQVRTGPYDVGAWEHGAGSPPPPPVLLP
jgi:hypothetical protein